MKTTRDTLPKKFTRGSSKCFASLFVLILAGRLRKKIDRPIAQCGLHLGGSNFSVIERADTTSKTVERTYVALFRRSIDVRLLLGSRFFGLLGEKEAQDPLYG